MNLNKLTALSPVDGRYRQQVDELAVFFSEYALIKYRVFVEIEYFIALSEIPLSGLNSLEKGRLEDLRNIYNNFRIEDAERIKEIEKITNHDVKAVEYFVKEQFSNLGFEAYSEFVHLGLTSQDINNTAVPLSLKDAVNEVYFPLIKELLSVLKELQTSWADIPMLARTHGQPASPTRLGKEIKVFHERLVKQTEMIRHIPWSAKFGGATGNFNAHHVAYPDIDWAGFANHFLNEILKLDRTQVTTQIEHYDNLAALFDNLKRVNTILIDLCRDLWTYISMDYFKQTIKAGEVGSSAMPHKVNPIDFENAEGNLGMANAVFEHLSLKLPVSRLQRDLTDSTVMRNIGVPLAHTVIAIKSLKKGMGKITVNKTVIESDLEDNWIVIAEAVQTILRREGYPSPFEVLKDLTRTGKKLTQKDFKVFIDSLEIDGKIKNELKAITPFNYTGIRL
ncbi:MAG: adenylosuccinate lyase [Bacteroidales bacterium]